MSTLSAVPAIASTHHVYPPTATAATAASRLDTFYRRVRGMGPGAPDHTISLPTKISGGGQLSLSVRRADNSVKVSRLPKSYYNFRERVPSSTRLFFDGQVSTKEGLHVGERVLGVNVGAQRSWDSHIAGTLIGVSVDGYACVDGVARSLAGEKAYWLCLESHLHRSVNTLSSYGRDFAVGDKVFTKSGTAATIDALDESGLAYISGGDSDSVKKVYELHKPVDEYDGFKAGDECLDERGGYCRISLVSEEGMAWTEQGVLVAISRLQHCVDEHNGLRVGALVFNDVQWGRVLCLTREGRVQVAALDRSQVSWRNDLVDASTLTVADSSDPATQAALAEEKRYQTPV